jgi:preprotein translocase subunit SecE
VKIANFYKEVKIEALKITWPSRKEALVSMGLVAATVAVSGLFFLLVDAILFRIVKFILG